MAESRKQQEATGGGAGTAGHGLPSTIHCVKCDYNVTGLTTGVCPSCGTRFAPESALPARQLDQPSFLFGLLVLYLLTGPGVVLALKSGMVVAAGIGALMAQPTCALLLGVAYGMRWTAGKPRFVRVLVCAGLMLAMIGVSVVGWCAALWAMGVSLSGILRRG